jgi:hypothetical protein
VPRSGRLCPVLAMPGAQRERTRNRRVMQDLSERVTGMSHRIPDQSRGEPASETSLSRSTAPASEPTTGAPASAHRPHLRKDLRKDRCPGG